MRPARLPQTEDDLAEWSVYADWLLTRNDPRGELLALELALPSEPSAEQLAEFQTRVGSQYRGRNTSFIAWTLFHARAVELHGRPHDTADAGTIASAIELFASDAGQFVEHVGFGITELDQATRRLIWRLPHSCTSLSIWLGERSHALRIEDLVGIIPATVRRIEVVDDCVGTRSGRLDWLIDDRWDVVAFGSGMNLDAITQLAARLAVTTHVKLAIEDTRRARLAWGELWLPWDRCAFGTPRDAVIVQPARGSAALLPRWGQVDLQRRYGPIPIRAQLAVALPEDHGLAFRFDHNGVPDIQRVRGSTLVRRGRSWTLRPDQIGNHVLNGASLRPGQIVPIAHGDRLAIESAECVFLTHDWAQAVRY
ncbi:MAG: hypothetical protein AB7P03_09670 [Kofleriaceae bacterium]